MSLVVRFMESELKAAVELVEQSTHFYKIILLKAIDVVGHVVPHFGVKMAGAVCERERQIQLATFLGLGLFRYHNK
jgi:hypothetical protein